MTMRADQLPPILIGIAVAAAIGLGLMVTGGPGTGRMEKRDARRLSDLAALGDYVVCLADAADHRLPEALTRSEACRQDTPFEDPFTGAPYRYERASDTSFRLCAGFERPALIPDAQMHEGRLERPSGCLIYRYPRP